MSKEPKIKPIVIVGAGGMGRDTQWLIERINEEEPTYEILGYIDDGIQQGSIIDGYPILGGMKYLEEYDKEQKRSTSRRKRRAFRGIVKIICDLNGSSI